MKTFLMVVLLAVSLCSCSMKTAQESVEWFVQDEIIELLNK